MSDSRKEERNIDETLDLLKKVWVLMAIGLYALCYYNELKFPGFREEPLPGEDILWKMERVLYFGLLAVGVLTDVVQMRIDRSKAFMYLFASLIVGGVSTLVASMQYKILMQFFGG